jgi:hypothetical protein
VRLDEETKRELLDHGLALEEANFEVKRDDLLKHEKQGHLTMLDKRHPRAEFEYQTRKPVFIEKWSVDIPLAHFMLTNINYSCTSDGGKRQRCEELIDGSVR